MILLWRISYLDSQDRAYKDRDLFLDTDTLDACTKAAVEAVYEFRDTGNRRGILKFRHLFHESQNVMADLSQLGKHPMPMSSFCISDYFEDENGKELNAKEMAHILTGKPNAVMFPAGTPEYEIKYAFANKPTIYIDEIELNREHLNVLGNFVRDFQKIVNSSFYKEEAFVLSGKFPDEMELNTAVPENEIESFVTTFRKLYMFKEPGNFLKSIVVFGEALQDHPVADYIAGIGKEYEAELNQPPKFVPYIGSDKTPFTRKRLLDVYINTKISHQPSPKREKQYRECLIAFKNCKPLLTWVFLSEIRQSAMHIKKAGHYIACIYDHYCRANKLNPDIITSMATDHSGIGQLETKQERQERILTEKASELAKNLWEEAGQPSCGPEQFMKTARQKLLDVMGWEDN